MINSINISIVLYIKYLKIIHDLDIGIRLMFDINKL